MTEAIVTTMGKKAADKKETHNPFLKRLNWLNNMLGDAYLGLSVIALALVIWLVIVLWKDPKGKIRKAIQKEK